MSHFHLFKKSSPLLSLSPLKVNLPNMTIESIKSETFRWLVPFHQECLWDLRVHRETAVIPNFSDKNNDKQIYIFCCVYMIYVIVIDYIGIQ